MPPNAEITAYSSQLDGSFRIASSKAPSKYGNGSILVENDFQFNGTGAHTLSSINSTDIILSSAKDLYHQSVANLSLDSGANASVKAVEQVSVESKKIDLSSVGTDALSTVEHQVNIVASSANAAITSKVNLSASEVNLSGKTTINGDLIVQGDTTTVKSVNVLLDDNLIILNGGTPELNRDAGVMFSRAGADNTVLFWDTTDNRFKFAYTETPHTEAEVSVKSLADVEFNKLYASTVESATNKTITVNLLDNRTDEFVEFSGLKTRGVYHFQVESVLEGGAVYDYKICKSKSSTNDFTAHGVHQPSYDTNEEVIIKWDADKPPAIYHKTQKTNGTGVALSYKVKYTTTD